MEPTALYRGVRAPSRAKAPASPEQYLEALDPDGVPRDLAPGVVRRASDGLSQRALLVAPIVLVSQKAERQPPAQLRGSVQPMSPVDFCREARRLRAVHEDDPVRMHQELGRLSMGAAREPVDPLEPEPARRSTPLRWPWMQTARLGKRGMSWLGGFRGRQRQDPEPPAPRPVDEEDGQPRHTLVDPDDPLPIDEGYPTSQDRSFSELVLRKLHGRRSGVLRYSERLELLKEAGRRGIGRFEANLIIASVQHRLRLTVPEFCRRRPLRLTGVIAFLALQGLILWGMWRVLRT